MRSNPLIGKESASLFPVYAKAQTGRKSRALNLHRLPNHKGSSHFRQSAVYHIPAININPAPIIGFPIRRFSRRLQRGFIAQNNACFSPRSAAFFVFPRLPRLLREAAADENKRGNRAAFGGV